MLDKFSLNRSYSPKFNKVILVYFSIKILLYLLNFPDFIKMFRGFLRFCRKKSIVKVRYSPNTRKLLNNVKLTYRLKVVKIRKIKTVLANDFIILGGKI